MTRNDIKWCAIGAGIGVTLLSLLAAVPSQTDFDSTYFKTNALPITLVDPFIYRSHQSDTGTNAVFVAASSTNLADSGTASLIAAFNGTSNVFYVMPNGCIESGRGAQKWGPDPFDLFIAVHDVSAGDPPLALSMMAVYSTNFTASSQYSFLCDEATTNTYVNLDIGATSAAGTCAFNLTVDSVNPNLDFALSGNTLFRIDTNTVTSQKGFTSTTGKSSIGSTNQWKYLGMTVDGGVTNLNFNVNGQNFRCAAVPY